MLGVRDVYDADGSGLEDELVQLNDPVGDLAHVYAEFNNLVKIASDGSLVAACIQGPNVIDQRLPTMQNAWGRFDLGVGVQLAVHVAIHARASFW
jgi:hypothetical protein